MGTVIPFEDDASVGVSCGTEVVLLVGPPVVSPVGSLVGPPVRALVGPLVGP